MKTRRALLAIVLLIGGLLRFESARRSPVEAIESEEFIPAAMTLTWDHHPARVAQHAAVPIYVIRASAALFGQSLLGFRLLGVLAGTLTILLLYLVGARWWGPVAGLVSAGLLAVERYHLEISARAIDLPFDLLCVAVSVYGFSRFLHARQQSPASPLSWRWLYVASAAAAVGFLCKEFTALLVPAMALSLFLVERLSWLRRREPWLALGLFVVLIVPDVYSNVTTGRADRVALRNRQNEIVKARGQMPAGAATSELGLYMSYGDHFSRFRSLGPNAEPFYFYFGDALEALGVGHQNEFGEFPYMHPALAMMLWLGVAWTLLRRGKDRAQIYLLTLFVVTFLPFALIQVGPPGWTTSSSGENWALWYWVDRTMLPAMLMTGCACSEVVSRLRAR